MKILSVDKDKAKVELAHEEMQRFISLCNVTTQKWWQRTSDIMILHQLPSAKDCIKLVTAGNQKLEDAPRG